MYHELENHLLKVSNDNVKYHLGIPDFQKSLKSYPKILYRHNSFIYDADSIYFIDKLHLTFSSQLRVDSKLYDIYYKRESYIVDDYLVLKSNYSNGNNYHLSFNIEFDGVHFGHIHLINTKNRSINKIEIDNRILYEKTIIYILARLYHIAEFMNLKFNNINLVEVARDSMQPVYTELSKIYYQSTKCNHVIHSLRGSNPIYKPVTKAIIHDYPSDDGLNGTFKIGAKKSNTIIKVYSKTSEIEGNNCKKDYIKEIHDNHFGKNQNITRVEAEINSNAFRKGKPLAKYGSSIIEILNPDNLASIFFDALGEKLTFNNIPTKSWNNSNNDKYEKIRIVPQLNPNLIKQKQLILRDSNIRFTHDNNVNKLKFKIVEYLDGDTTYSEFRRYLIAKKDKDELNVEELVKAFNMVKRNYKNSLFSSKFNRVNQLIILLNKEKLDFGIKTLLNFIRVKFF